MLAGREYNIGDFDVCVLFSVIAGAFLKAVDMKVAANSKGAPFIVGNREKLKVLLTLLNVGRESCISQVLCVRDRS